MAKFDESGGEVLIGKPGKPPPKPRPPRKFPFRLLLWALLMTGTTGALGYYAWQYRAQGIDRSAKLTSCEGDLGKLSGEHGTATTQLTACQGELTTATTRQKEIDTQLAQMQSNLGSTKDELTALRAQRAETEKQLGEMKKIEAKFREMVDTGKLKVKSRRGSMVVELPAEVLFPSGSAELQDQGKIAVYNVGFILNQVGDRRFLVVGHTDNVPLKGSKYLDNWELSAARALMVTRELVKAGMKPENLIPAGAGEHDPAADNSGAKERQENRRIEIVLLPALAELPALSAEEPAAP